MNDGDDRDIQSLFLLGCPTAKEPEQMGLHTLALPCQDDYRHLPHKTRLFAQWALQRKDWDYLFKCDDDTYISMPRFLDYDPAGRDYIGAEWRPGAGYGSGGAGYFLSRLAAGYVAEFGGSYSLDSYPPGAEDMIVGALLRANGVEFSIEPRLIPFATLDLRPKKNNDLITSHACTEAFMASHEETGNEAVRCSWSRSDRRW